MTEKNPFTLVMVDPAENLRSEYPVLLRLNRTAGTLLLSVTEAEELLDMLKNFLDGVEIESEDLPFGPTTNNE